VPAASGVPMAAGVAAQDCACLASSAYLPLSLARSNPRAAIGASRVKIEIGQQFVLRIQRAHLA